MPYKTPVALSLAMAIALPAASASAQSLEDFAGCTAIAGDGERLRCFDALAAQLATTAEERREQAVAQAEKDFGLPPERRKDVAARLEIDHEVNARVAGIGASGNLMTVTLDNGQVWKITSSGRLQKFLRPGISVSIGEGAISGYRLRSDEINGMETVRRIQ